MPQDEQDYLNQIAHETWNFLEWNVSPVTALPYDGYPRGNQYTSVTNIGFYLASLAVAHELGFISQEQVLTKAQKALTSIQKFKMRSGFIQSWNHPDTLEPSPDDPWISTLDSGNLAAGLIVLKELVPSVKHECEALLTAMDWKVLFNPEKNLLYGGMKLASGEINPHWHLELLGADSRLAYVIAIGSDHVPSESWGVLSRAQEERYQQSYFTPGWQGGGLFMQHISGIFLDERKTVLGQSAAQFAYAQILHAKLLNSPLWGWSASVDPKGGYLGWDHIQDEVVTPHASSFGLYYFPQDTIKNMKKLDEYGLRQAVILEDGSKLFLGYADAWNWQEQLKSSERLTLDQAMLFLTLANVLKEGIIWQSFKKDLRIAKAMGCIKDYQLMENVSYFTKGYRGLYIRHIDDKWQVSCLNDGLEGIKDSFLSWAIYDETLGQLVLKNKISVSIDSGEVFYHDIPIPNKEKTDFYIKAEWQDAQGQTLAKGDNLLHS